MQNKAKRLKNSNINEIIKTKRLILRPMSDDEVRGLIEKTEDEEMKKAYGEMLAGSIDNPEQRLWYTPWAMELKKEKIFIGDLCFKGPAKDDAVEIGYGIHPEYENNGYTTEAARALIDWAFKSENVFFVEAEAEATNKPSLRVLLKLGFREYGVGEEGPRFVAERPTHGYIGIGMCFGIAIGLSIGNMFDSGASIGMCSGIAIGVGIGTLIEQKKKKQLNEARKRRNERLGIEREESKD